ncbi:MAG: hypothetical protein Q9208_007335 [Pyrenodesmia sp. 3 TL-2023]
MDLPSTAHSNPGDYRHMFGRDRQAGPGHWRGCHSFKKITCDGNDIDVSGGREGALRMGVTYWYFYRLDNELEQHDPGEPSTTACPLLPGQQVNVLDVPIQRGHDGDQGHCAQTLLDSMVFTLDPNAKYNPPKPSITRDILREYDKYRSTATVTPLGADGDRQQSSLARCSTASSTALQPLKRMRPATNQGPCIGLPKASSLMAVFHKMRGLRSLPGTSKTQGKERRRPPTPRWEFEESNVRVHRTSLTGTKASRVRAPLNTPEWPVAPTQTRPATPWTAGSSSDPPAAERLSLDLTSHRSLDNSQTGSHSRYSEDNFYSSLYSRGVRSLQTIRRSNSASRDTQPDQSSIQPEPKNAPTSTAAVSSTIKSRDAQEHAGPQELTVGENCLDATLETFYATSSSCGGPLSPHHLSQPETPSVRDFEEAWDTESQTRADLSLEGSSRAKPPLADHENPLPPLDLLQMPQLPSPGFQGYSLPEQDYGSALTLRKPASAHLDPTQQPLSENEQLVQSWDDGSGHPHLTSLDELIDDLGHLGQAIV